MLLDTSKPFEAKKAQTRLDFLIGKGAKIDITEKRPPRSVRQNSYQHALFSLFALEFGYTEKEVKQNIFKKDVNEQLFKIEFTNKETGEVSDDWRSSSDLDTKETTLAIERFRNYSAQHGLYLLTSDEYIEQKFYIDQQIQENKQYL